MVYPTPPVKGCLNRKCLIVGTLIDIALVNKVADLVEIMNMHEAGVPVSQPNENKNLSVSY